MQSVNKQHSDTGSQPRLTFSGGKAFHRELRRRVDAWFSEPGRRKRDCPAMYLKTGIILAAFFATWSLLVFVAQAWWQALPLAIILGLATAGIGFNIEHDGGHNAYSNRRWVNRLMAFTLDLIGGSSYLWRWKHAVFHHTYVNIKGQDTDIDLGVLARLSPHHRRFGHQRWQHWYAWFLYGVMAIKWHFYDDFQNIITGQVGEHRIPRPKGLDLAQFIIGKLIFFALAFGIPLLFHSITAVAVFYCVTAAVTGIVLSVVFQLAHCVGEARFVMPDADGAAIDNAWAVHQVESSVNFARDSRLAAWYLGGLNFQIEHHLLPNICHINYPAIAPLVQQTCEEFGVRYAQYSDFMTGLKEHFLWLREMGRAPAVAIE